MKKLLTRTLIYFLVAANGIAFAQNEHGWWYEIHQHDGVTPWQRYLIMSPAFFGPNALPVPEINQGLIKSDFELESSIEAHYNSHEQTYNLYTKLFIPLYKNRVGIQLSIVPVEFFSYDSLIRDQRFSRNYEGKGHANGDLYIATQIQLLKNHRIWPDLLLGMHLRTASGNNFNSARFTDAPGYFFEISAGKSFNLNEDSSLVLRAYSMLGFYVWQTNLFAHFQDDAFLYGFGFKLSSKTISLVNELGGYYGYLNNGDRPLIYHFRLKTNFNKKINFGLQFEQGLQDYNFRSLRVSIFYVFKS